ncbi:hypothetical protein ACPCIR_12630 [Mycobacterium sp. NPDC051198]
MAGVLAGLGCGVLLGLTLFGAFSVAFVRGICPIDAILDRDTIHPF